MGHKIIWLLACVALVFALLFGAYFAIIEFGGEQAQAWLYNIWIYTQNLLTENGPLLFLAIAILPGFILPVAPLLGFAGLWGGVHGPWLSCIYCSMALFVNLCWTYWFAHGPARGVLIKLLSRTRFQLPEGTPKNMIEWALILRLTPGVPFIFTNYTLGLLGMSFTQYISVSLPILAFTASGYVLAFAGIFGGEWKYLWTGACIIAVTILLGRFAIKRKHRHAN
jgi:uncharacterized membrane protein YdjX (TVP38/TMEM64 family)